MLTLNHATPAVKPATVTAGTADAWPSWTDCPVPMPTDEPTVEYTADDAQWWADQNTDYHSADEPTDADFDAMADEAAALDSHERGYVHA